MDKLRKIEIKHEQLRHIRNNLRKLLGKIIIRKCLELQEKGEEFNDFSVQSDRFFKISQELRRAYDKSILYCSICGSKTSDMIYFPQWDRWFCISCAEGRGWINEPELKEKLTMTRAQIRHFLIALDAILEHKPCRTDHRYARQVLYQIGIEPEQQEIFLELCKINGGYCDCEIMMNAAPELAKLGR